ncbi:LysR family transcriptional regulator ArgP [Rothia sp. P6271]|uniref:LysR family transcriptional regulator ArgP n=1 Tax=Rothia sp. P6271 TaxID=3402659 RepID=UPI003ACD3948
MTRFTNEQLRTFTLVVDEGTFEAAAEILGVSASAISQRIKTMETSAGRILLQRTNPVRPTDSGEVVLRVARQNEYLNAELEQELGERSGQGSITIAVNSDSLATWLLSAVGELSRCDKIFCDLRREGEQHSSALLRSGEVMAAITSHPEPINGCEVEELGQARYWCVASQEFVDEHFKSWPHHITAEELNTAPVIEFDRKDHGQRSSRHLILKAHNIEDNGGESPSIYIPSSPDYARAVEDGIGWGLVPEAQCRQGLESGTIISLAGEKPLEFPLYWQRWKISSRILDRVTERIYEAAQKYLEPKNNA